MLKFDESIDQVHVLWNELTKFGESKRAIKLESLEEDLDSLSTLAMISPTRLWTAINRIGQENSNTLVKSFDSQLEQLITKWSHQFKYILKSANDLFQDLSAAGAGYSDNKKKRWLRRAMSHCTGCDHAKEYTLDSNGSNFLPQNQQANRSKNHFLF